MKYDVVVIGASSAGLFAAEILAKSGKRVAVFERAESFAPDIRTYIITPGLFRVMPDVESELILHEINAIYLQTGRESAVIQLSSPDLIVERVQLITTLLNRAKSAGVEVHFGTEFKGLITKNGTTRVNVLSNSTETLIEADYLIGADGVASTVGKAAGLPDLLTVPLLQVEINLPENWDPGVVKVWFDYEDTPYFYWLIPDSETKAVVGLITQPGANIRVLLDRFLAEKSFHPLAYQSGIAALYSPGNIIECRVGDLKVMLVGDAAGQVKVTTVGGTVTGLSGGQAAACAILDEVTYRKTRKGVTRELDLHLLIRKLLEKMDQKDYERLVELISPNVQSFLSRHDRDAMRYHFWKLILIQPRFIPLGIKLLLRRK